MKNNTGKFKLKIAGALLFVVSIGSSCTGTFETTNTRPYEPTVIDKRSLITQMQLNVIAVEKNPFQLSQNLVGDIYSGFMSPINNFKNNQNHATYVFPEDWSNHPYNTVYTVIFGAWMDLKREEKTTNMSPAFALAEILKISSMHRFTDMWGPMPYSKVGSGSMQVEYDSQEDIYKQFFVELNAAIDVLTAYTLREPGKTPLREFDLVYGGDFVKWVKYANSLKLRLAVRLAYVAPALAQEHALAAINHQFGVITSVDDNAILKGGNGVTISNPLADMWDNYNDIRMGASISSYMNGYADPRLSAYFQQSGISTHPYIGLRLGLTIPSKTPDLQSFSSPKVMAGDPIVWMAASEVAFLKAECALRGWNVGVTDEQAYADGVKFSFAEKKSSGVETYLISDAVPTNYVDPKAAANSINTTATITPKWNTSATTEVKLERIITQKWIALFPNGQEAWSEFRRTGYPKLFPIKVNNSGGKVDTNIQVRRMQFPYSERNANAENYAKAVTLLGGPDTGGTKLWWDKK